MKRLLTSTFISKDGLVPKSFLKRLTACHHFGHTIKLGLKPRKTTLSEGNYSAANVSFQGDV